MMNRFYPAWFMVLLALAVLTSKPAGTDRRLVAEEPKNSGSGKEASPVELGDPWDLDNPPRPFHEICFESFPAAKSGLTPNGARRWLEQVQKQPLELKESSNQYGHAVTIKGLAKLRAPWVPDSVLRLALYSDQPFKLHFWNRARGVTLHYYRQGNRQTWAAYRATVPPGGQLLIGKQQHTLIDPGTALLATDNQRFDRTPGGTFELRHQNGSLVMTKGDVQMLRVPLEEMPKDVFFQGSSLLVRHIAMVRGGPAPEEPRLEQPKIVLHGQRPALLRWETKLPAGAEWKQLDDGRVELASKNNKEPAWAWIPLVRPGIYEVIFEIEDATPGTGIFLGNKQRPTDEPGKLIRVGLLREGQTGLNYLAYDLPGASQTQTQTQTKLNLDQSPISYVGQRQWLRVVWACGMIKCWTSGDGKHWGQILEPKQQVGAFTRIGLYAQPGIGTRGIKLRRLQVRQLNTLVSLAPIRLQERAAALRLLGRNEEKTDLGAWQQKVWDNQPAKTDSAEWRRACAIATLVAGPQPPLAKALIHELLAEALAGPAPLESKLQLLRDAALVYDAGTAKDAAGFAEHFKQLSQTLLRRSDGGTLAFDLLFKAMMETPLWTIEDYRIEPLNVQLIRKKLLTLVYQQKGPQVYAWCRQLKFWNQPANLAPLWPGKTTLHGLVSWAKAQAPVHLPKQPKNEGSLIHNAWRHPVDVQLNKEAFNIKAELQGALDEKSYQHACRIITSATSAQQQGLVPNAKDSRLFQSLPLFVDQAMREHQQFRQTMKSQFASIGTLRLRRAIAQNDSLAIKIATMQYHQTPTAAEAHLWLGDQLMSQGHFAQAIIRYQQALPMATTSQKHRLAARKRLAAAMLGSDQGEPVTRMVYFGDLQLTSQQFEQLVSEMLEKHIGSKATSASIKSSTGFRLGPVPGADKLPAQFELRPWGNIQNPAAGTQAKKKKEPDHASSLDWSARQTTLAIEDGLMIVSNRIEVTAFDLSEGKLKWTYRLGAKSDSSRAWSLVPMRLLVAGSRIYLRLLNKGRPQIACLDLRTGQSLWTSNYAGHIVSDPMVIHGNLFALTLDQGRRLLTSQLVLTTFDIGSGTVLGRKPVLNLHRKWQLQHVCQVTRVDNKIVANIGGGVVCFDLFGQVHWVRRSLWIPPELDGRGARQYHQPPLIDVDRMFVTQPGVKAIECLDVDSGRLHWAVALPRVRRILGLVEKRLLVQTDDGIRAISTQTGRILWRHEVENLFDGYLLDDSSNSLVYIKAPRAGKEHTQSLPTLVWLNVQTGQIKNRSTLSISSESAGRIQSAIGPLVTDGGRHWCFVSVRDAKGQLLPQRKILELVPTSQNKAKVADVPKTIRPWTSNVPVELQSAVAATFPGWTVLSGVHDEQTGRKAALAGKQNVLVTKAAETPTRLALRVDVPKLGKPHLLLEIGDDQKTRSRLDIRAGGIPVAQIAIEPSSAAKQWKQFEIDLSAFAGQRVWITISHQRAGETDGYAYWKRLELMPRRKN